MFQHRGAFCKNNNKKPYICSILLTLLKIEGCKQVILGRVSSVRSSTVGCNEFRKQFCRSLALILVIDPNLCLIYFCHGGNRSTCCSLMHLTQLVTNARLRIKIGRKNSIWLRYGIYCYLILPLALYFFIQVAILSKIAYHNATRSNTHTKIIRV